MNKTLTMEFPSLNFSLSATLFEDKNPEICEVLWNHMPFECLQEHAVISGEGLYAWAPIVTTAPVRTYEKLTEAAVGRLLYTQMTGNKIGMLYGPISEPLEHVIPVGQVLDCDLEKVKAVGKAVWESTFYTKKIIRVVFKKGEEAQAWLD